MNSTATLLIAEPGRAVEQARSREQKQKDELCGAFCAAVAIEAISGVHLSQDALAQAAGTVLSGGADPALPPGETSRLDYLAEFPIADDPATAGTSATGLVRAVNTIGGDDIVAIPLTGTWTTEAVSLLIDLVQEPDTAVVLNVATRHLWPTHTDLLTAHAYLDGDPAPSLKSEWDVGHFILLIGSYVGRERRLAVCGDTYPTLGSGGTHLQPLEALAAGMNREDDPASTGGALVITAPARGESIRERARAGGLVVEPWDNGTPDAGAPI